MGLEGIGKEMKGRRGTKREGDKKWKENKQTNRQTDRQTNRQTIWSIVYQNKGHSASGNYIVYIAKF